MAVFQVNESWTVFSLPARYRYKRYDEDETETILGRAQIAHLEGEGSQGIV